MQYSVVRWPLQWMANNFLPANCKTIILMCVTSQMYEQSTNHISLKNRLTCYAKSLTVQDTFWPIPGLISCAGYDSESTDNDMYFLQYIVFVHVYGNPGLKTRRNECIYGVGNFRRWKWILSREIVIPSFIWRHWIKTSLVWPDLTQKGLAGYVRL